MRRTRIKLLVAASYLAVQALVVPKATGQSWDDLSPRERYDAFRHYEQYRRESKQRQEELEKRYRRWRELPPETRRHLRERYQQFEGLPAQKRRELEQKLLEREGRDQDAPNAD